jgi:hypothetical protein
MLFVNTLKLIFEKLLYAQQLVRLLKMLLYDSTKQTK